MDCFYAAVEMRDNPRLKNFPIAIGGPSKTKGVLCTSNYKAREFGVRAAMPTFKAFELCPNLVLIPPNFSKYQEVSNIVREIFKEYTDKVQMVSLDEAYLDVTNSPHCEGSAILIAKEIKEKILQRTMLTASAGVSYNKMLAKIASDWRKPNGIYCIRPEDAKEFLKTLSLKKIPGIGSVTFSHLEKLGLKTTQDVIERGLYPLIELLGKRSALNLFESCLGIDNSIVETSGQRKSLGIETTFFDNINDLEQLKNELDNLISEFDYRLQEANVRHFDKRRISHLFFKIRYDDFQTHTRDIMIDEDLAQDIYDSRQLNQEAQHILKEVMTSFCQSNNKNIRLIGFGIRFADGLEKQLALPL